MRPLVIAACALTVTQIALPARAVPVAGQEEIAQSLDRIGPALTRETVGATMKLFAPLHPEGLPDGVSALMDQSYGPDPRNTLDVFMPETADGAAPIVTLAHGGGFVRGDKAELAHVGKWLASQGYVAVVWNYRLAPDATWPSGIEDQQAVLDWIRDHPELHRGDASRIVLAGHSAGSIHVADWIAAAPSAEQSAGVIGAALLSPPSLDLTEREIDPQRDALYFGTDPQALAARSAIKGLVARDIPLMVGIAEHDPPVVKAQSLELFDALQAGGKPLPVIATAIGHTHISIVEHLGTADAAFGAELAGFIAQEALRAGS